jgi:hypothetical protein
MVEGNNVSCGFILFIGQVFRLMSNSGTDAFYLMISNDSFLRNWETAFLSV